MRGYELDIKELNYIVAIAEEGSISKAAERLFMAQSGLSQFLQI
ncbi:MAG: LysR family transcriptional regulator, partial [Synergistaceae bacterium]|nr:LysR family transcriptional regulator [Synergistaceae bacterium]